MNIKITGSEIEQGRLYAGVLDFEGCYFRWKFYFGPGLIAETLGSLNMEEKKIRERVLVDIYDYDSGDYEISIDGLEEEFLIKLVGKFAYDLYEENKKRKKDEHGINEPSATKVVTRPSVPGMFKVNHPTPSLLVR